MKNEHKDPQYLKWQGDKFKELRTHHDFKQSYIAAKIKVKAKTYESYEEKRATAPAKVWANLARLYNTTVDKLMEGMPGTVLS